jgi:hypothetical protein
MKLIISALKVAAIVLLASGAITILADILGIIDTTLIVAFFVQLSEISIPFSIFLDFPNFWIVMGYFIFKAIVMFGIDILKKQASNA